MKEDNKNKILKVNYNFLEVDFENMTSEYLCKFIKDYFNNIIYSNEKLLQFSVNEKGMECLSRVVLNNKSYLELILGRINKLYYNKSKNKYFSNIVFRNGLEKINSNTIANLSTIKELEKSDKLFEISIIFHSLNSKDFIFNIIDSYNLSIDSYLEILDMKVGNDKVLFLDNILSHNIIDNKILYEVIGNYINEIGKDTYTLLYSMYNDIYSNKIFKENFRTLSLKYPRSRILYNQNKYEV